MFLRKNDYKDKIENILDKAKQSKFSYTDLKKSNYYKELKAHIEQEFSSQCFYTELPCKLENFSIDHVKPQDKYPHV